MSQTAVAPTPQGTDQPVLDIVGISKRFGAVQALTDVSLRVHAGEVVALVGDNGAGKSTLVKAIAGVYKPDSGVMRLAGKEVSPTGPRDAQALGISTVFQDLALCDNLDVVANIAGILRAAHSTEHSLELWDQVIRVNLTSTFLVCRAALPHLLDGGGSIINSASTSAEFGHPWMAAYAASKGGIVSMTLPIARDLAAVGVRLNSVAPGLVDTPIYGEGEQAEELKARLAQSVLFPPRLGRPDEVAAMVLECLRNSYLNASVVRVDGGIRLPPR